MSAASVSAASVSASSVWAASVWAASEGLAIRAMHPHGAVYTFWDYQAGAWQRDMGLRIDHALLSPALAERLIAADPDKQERAQPQPSDHVPVVITLSQ